MISCGLKALDYHDDDGVQPSIGDKGLGRSYELFDLDDTVLKTAVDHVIHNSIEAIFKQAYEDYIVAEPDPDSGSVILIDKATGRLARGRTLNISIPLLK